MIRFLSIRDLAVIDHLELELDAGLNVLTGETGAGKSIVVGALALLRGGRASSELVRTGADQAVVEAAAETTDGRERVLRREVSAHGRSRAFIDDRLVSTSSLRALGAEFLDLHGQHEHQALLDPTSHLDLLDRYAHLGTVRDDVRALEMMPGLIDLGLIFCRSRSLIFPSEKCCDRRRCAVNHAPIPDAPV